MTKSKFVTALDIGSSKICGVVAQAEHQRPLSILAHASYPCGGISRGEITDLNEAVDAVSKVMRALSDKVPKMPKYLYVNISGHGIKGEKARGMIPLSARGREVTLADMDRCVNVASTLRLAFDREIIHKITHSFSIDDQPAIKNPLGLYASRLACEIYVITANVNHIQNVYKCVNNAGYDVKEAVFTGMADGAALLEDIESEEGALLLNGGASITEISIFSGGALRDVDVAPIGMDDIRGDLRASHELNSMLERTKSRMDEFLSKGGRINSVKLTGGIIFNDAIVDLLTENIKFPIRIASPKDIRGNISSLDAMKAATAIGLVKYAYEGPRPKPFEAKGILHSLSSKVVDIFNSYF